MKNNKKMLALEIFGLIFIALGIVGEFLDLLGIGGYRGIDYTEAIPITIGIIIVSLAYYYKHKK